MQHGTCKFRDGAPAADAEAGDVGREPLVLLRRPQPFPHLLLLGAARVYPPHLLLPAQQWRALDSQSTY